jgi:hypothetical protein
LVGYVNFKSPRNLSSPITCLCLCLFLSCETHQ